VARFGPGPSNCRVVVAMVTNIMEVPSFMVLMSLPFYYHFHYFCIHMFVHCGLV
jgi:hypothetical protein